MHMTGYERIMCVLNGGIPDRVPMMLHCFVPASEEQGYTQGQYRNSARAIADSHIKFAEKYDMDGMLIDVDTCVEADAIGIPVDYPEQHPARVKGHISIDFDVLKRKITPEKLYNSKRINTILDAVRMIKEEVGGDILIRGNCDQMGFSLAMLAYGMNDFMASLLDEDIENEILELIDRCTDVHIAYHKLMKQAGADITSFGDSSCGPDLISLDMYRRFAKPFHQKLQKEMERENIKTICHICGNTDLILPDLTDIGFAGIEVDYKTNIEKAAELMHGKNVLFGPIDPSGVFYFGTPDVVTKETQQVLDIFKGKNLVIGSGCALPSGTSEENIRAFANQVKAYRIP